MDLLISKTDLLIVLVIQLLKTKKERKNLSRRGIQIIFTRIILIRLAFNKIWVMINIKTGNTDYIYENYLDKACFQQDMVYGKYKDLNKRTQSDKILKDKVFKIESNSL